jgi:hypothetical protein
MEKGIRQFDIRKNDRDDELGDTIILHEYDIDRKIYKRGWLPRKIVCMVNDPQYVKDGQVILGLKEIKF